MRRLYAPPGKRGLYGSLPQTGVSGLGLFIRFTVGESPVFAKVHEAHSEAKSPLSEVIRSHPWEVLRAVGSRFAEAGNYYIFTVLILAYAVDRAGMNRRDVLLCVMAGALANVITIPFWGALSDRIGRRPVIIFGALLMAVSTYPFFLAANTGLSLVLPGSGCGARHWTRCRLRSDRVFPGRVLPRAYPL